MQRLSKSVPMLMSYILSQPPPFFRYLVELLVVSPLASGFGHGKAERPKDFCRIERSKTRLPALQANCFSSTTLEQTSIILPATKDGFQ